MKVCALWFGACGLGMHAVYDIFNESSVVWGFVREVCTCRRLTAGE